MLLIVAHHYVMNSGLYGFIQDAPLSYSSAAMVLFGAWGKTGINCFVMITGWFMCRSRFTWQKFIKLYLQITLYALAIYGIFCITGHETFHPLTAIMQLFPVKSIADGFVSCFLIFYLLIPFLNILVQNLEKKQLLLLLVTLLVVYTFLPTFPGYRLSFNYVSWFVTIYFLASFIRLHGFGVTISHRMWGWIALASIIIASACVLSLFALNKFGYMNTFMPYFFISDSNKILALAVAVSSFMWFKDLRIPHSRFINAIGGATFGVLLIHANSEAMREWLWKETVDSIGHFGDSLIWTLSYATFSVIVIFIVCAGIDWFRGRLIEPQYIKFFEKIFK